MPNVRMVHQPKSVQFVQTVPKNVAQAPVQRRVSETSHLLPSQMAKVIKPEPIQPILTHEPTTGYQFSSTNPFHANYNEMTPVRPEPFTKVDRNLVKSPPTLMKSTSVQDRLAVIKRSVSSEEDKSQQSSVADDSVQESSSTKDIPLEWWATENMSVVARLEQYCSLKQLPPPDYTYFKVKEGKQYKFQCRVTIEDSTYSTYPEDFDTKDKARIVCAARAVDSIKLRQGMTQYPLFDGDSYELVCKIFDIVSAHTTGVFFKEIPNLFR